MSATAPTSATAPAPARSGAVSPLAGRRVLFVLEHLELGGAESQAIGLAEWLQRERGAAVEIWGLGPWGRAAALASERGLTCRALGAPLAPGWTGFLRAQVRLARALRAARADAVLSYTLVPNVLCALAAGWGGARLTVWNQRDAGIGRIGRRIERAAVKRVRVFVSNSIPGARFLERSLGVEPARIHLVPNAVLARSVQRPARAWREALGIGGEAFVLVMIANLHVNKDHETLLRAAADAFSRWPLVDRPPLLVLAGRDGGTRAALEARAGELGLRDRVRFTGPVEDVAGLLGVSDLAVFSSRQEGCPNGVLEAMAAGLAVVGTDIEGIRDLVGGEGAALLAPAGDPGSLAGRILDAARDAALRAHLGEANRHRALTEFSLSRRFAQMAAILEEGLASR